MCYVSPAWSTGRFMGCNVNGFLSIHKEHHWYSLYTLFFLVWECCFFRPRLNILIFLSILFLNYSLLHFRFRKYWGINYSQCKFFSSCWRALPYRQWNKLKTYNRIVSTVFEHTNMAAVSLFWDTNMAAMTSCENTHMGIVACAFSDNLSRNSCTLSYILE